MKKFIKPKELITILIVFSSLSLAAGCDESKMGTHSAKRQHWIQVDKKGIGSFFIDPVPNKFIMSNSPAAENEFLAYLIGFEDSIPVSDKKTLLARGKYYQYEMQYDWTSIINGDSLKPVFFQPKVKVQQGRDEFIMVFEVDPAHTPDALIYHDSFGKWGTQKMVLN